MISVPDLEGSLFEKVGIVSQWSGRMNLEKALDELRDEASHPTTMNSKHNL